MEAVRKGATVLNLSDKLSDQLSNQNTKQHSKQHPTEFVSYSETTYIPPLLAVAAVHHQLIQHGLRTSASIIVTTGQVWSTHHFACLIGYGASAIIPYIAYDAVINWHGQKRNQFV